MFSPLEGRSSKLHVKMHFASTMNQLWTNTSNEYNNNTFSQLVGAFHLAMKLGRLFYLFRGFISLTTFASGHVGAPCVSNMINHAWFLTWWKDLHKFSLSFKLSSRMPFSWVSTFKEEQCYQLLCNLQSNCSRFIARQIRWTFHQSLSADCKYELLEFIFYIFDPTFLGAPCA